MGRILEVPYEDLLRVIEKSDIKKEILELAYKNLDKRLKEKMIFIVFSVSLVTFAAAAITNAAISFIYKILFIIVYVLFLKVVVLDLYEDLKLKKELEEKIKG